MNTLLTVGVDHRVSALAQLERVAAPTALADLSADARAAGCAEVLVLSTCGRTELHTVVDSPSPAEAAVAITEHLVATLARCLGSRAGIRAYLGEDAVHHLFRVAAGLDSRVVGEVEVQAQLRAAARSSWAARGEPHRLRHLVAAAHVAARDAARSHPGLLRQGLLAERAVSRALTADDERTPPPVNDALVVGAGTIGRQVVQALDAAGRHTTLLGRTRTPRTGHGPRVHPLAEFPRRLATSDVLFMATSAGRQILSRALVRDVVKNRPRPLRIVDLSMPRNVAPTVAALDRVHLFDLDDLADEVCGTSADPTVLASVEAVVTAAATAYCAELKSRRAGPVIGQLRDRVHEICLHQTRRTTKGLALPEDVLVRIAASVAAAVIHRPTLLARQAAAEDDTATLALLAAAFDLPRPEV